MAIVKINLHAHFSYLFLRLAALRFTKTKPEMREVAVESASRVVDAVEQNGLVLLLNELVGPMQDTDSAMRRVVAAQLFKHFFEKTSHLDGCESW